MARLVDACCVEDMVDFRREELDGKVLYHARWGRHVLVPLIRPEHLRKAV